MHRGELILTGINGSAKSSRCREEHDAMVPNMVLSQADDTSPATMKISEEDVDGRTCTECHYCDS